MSRLLACLVVAVGVGPAAACINDAELPNHEREFRSQYNSSPAPPQPASPEPAGRLSVGVLVSAGAVLLAASAALTLIGLRARN